MKRFFKSEAGAVVLWVCSAMVLGATLAPWIFRLGKDLADAVKVGDMGTFLEWLGNACDRARFSRFYSRSLSFSAIILLPVLWWRLRVIYGCQARCQKLKTFAGPWRSTVIQVLVAFSIAAGLLWSAGLVAEMLGTYQASPRQPSFGKFVSRVLVPAVSASFLEEWLFRGVLLGIWLKLARPFPAALGTSLFFAFIHFLEPPEGCEIASPESPLAGFELLGKILYHFVDPRFFVADFAVLFTVGMILAWARVRTGTLWFSIGLHAGWIFAFKGFNLIHDAVPGHALRPWVVGDSLRSGLIPLFTLAFTAGICHFVMRPAPGKETP